MNKNINLQQIIITTQIFGTQWNLYQEQKKGLSFPYFYFLNNDQIQTNKNESTNEVSLFSTQSKHSSGFSWMIEWNGGLSWILPMSLKFLGLYLPNVSIELLPTVRDFNSLL